MQNEVAMTGFAFGLYWATIVGLIGYAVGKAVQLFYRIILGGGGTE